MKLYTSHARVAQFHLFLKFLQCGLHHLTQQHQQTIFGMPVKVTITVKKLTFTL